MKEYIPYIVMIIMALSIWTVYDENSISNSKLKLEIIELKKSSSTLIKNDSIKSIADIKYRNRIDSILLLDSISLENSKLESSILKTKYRSLEKKYNHINGVLGELPEF